MKLNLLLSLGVLFRGSLSCVGVRRHREHSQVGVKNIVVPNGEGAFYIKASAQHSWETLMSVLIKDYPLSVVEKESGLLATGWKSRYQEGSVIRERLSAQITGVARNESELRFYLQTEILSNGTAAQLAALGLVWLPQTSPKNRRLDMLAEELNQALVRRYSSRRRSAPASHVPFVNLQTP